VLAAAAVAADAPRGLLASFLDDPLGGVRVEFDRLLTSAFPVADEGRFFAGG
jgi:hypothetical protein